MVPTNIAVHNKKLKKNTNAFTLRQDLIICFVDIMKQTLKSKKRKPIFHFLHQLIDHQNVY